MGWFGKENERDRQREQSWRLWLQRQDPLALSALVLGVFSLSHFGSLLVDGLAGVILGSISIRRMARPDAQWREGKRLAIVGIFCALISLAIATMLYLRLPPFGSRS